jgi:signal peptidase I
MKSQQQDYSYQGVGEFILEIIKIVALAFIIIVPIRVFLFQPFFVQGASMEPNFEDGQYLIINEFGFKETDIALGSHSILDIKSFKQLDRQHPIVFRYPVDPKKFFIKRVIGLPGEKVKIENNEITIYNSEYPNGFVLDEKEYIPATTKTKGDIMVTLKDNQYYVLGDNRSFSSDSRSWGPVPKEDIVGEVLLRAWPLDKMSVY